MPIPRPLFIKGQENKGVFLTHTPAAVYFSHGRKGNLYAFKVPTAVEKAVKRHWYDGAQQIIVTEDLWPLVKFLGRVKDSKVEQILNHPFYTDSRSYNSPVRQPYMIDRDHSKSLLEKHKDRLSFLEKIEDRVVKAFPVVRHLLEKEKGDKSPAKEYLWKIPNFPTDFLFYSNEKVIFKILLEAVQNKKVILEGGKFKGKPHKKLMWMIKNLTTMEIFYFMTAAISYRKKIIKDNLKTEEFMQLSEQEKRNVEREDLIKAIKKDMDNKMRKRRENTK